MCMQGWKGVQGKCTSREGRVHIGQQALSLGQADIFGPAKGFRSCVGGRVVLAARPAIQACTSCSCFMLNTSDPVWDWVAVPLARPALC